jgi:murein DD-endopeptidase MepM/ murein hydrolase activator NlpD
VRTLIITLSLIALVLGGTAVPASASVLDDGLTFPQDPTVTHFSNTWGASRSGGRRHKGSDLMAPKLTPVYAIADGVVVRMHHSRLGGYGIEIDHGGGVSSVYIHLNNDTPGTDDGRGWPDWTYAPGLEIGDTVTRGQFIAFVGDSGNAEWTAPHTHFEIHINGRAQNPYHYLKPVFDAELADREAADLAVRVATLQQAPAVPGPTPATAIAVN